MSESVGTSTGPLVLPRLPGAGLFAAVAAVVTVVGIVVQPDLGWAGLLHAALYGFSLALGGAVFIAINAVAKADWWYPIRHVAVGLTRTWVMPAAAIVASVALGLTALYPWARPGVVAASELLQAKAAWLNRPFFVARCLSIVVVWGLLAGSLRRGVLEAWSEPSERTANGLVRRAAIALVLFAVTISVAFWDWSMSLEPEWFSTMYGVRGFASVLQGGVAAVVVLAVLSARARGELMPSPALHSLGLLLFGFSMFWAYIWFSESMLIWYANLPEETPHFAARLAGGWGLLFWLNPLLNFVIPFAVLLSSRLKRHSATVYQVALLLLAGRWLDIYLLIGPAIRPEVAVPVYSATATVVVLIGMGAIYLRADDGPAS